MKSITKITIAAIALIGVSASAHAAPCPANSKSFNNVSHDLDDLPGGTSALPGFLQSRAIPGTAFEGVLDGDGDLDDCWTPAGLGSQSVATGTISGTEGEDEHGKYNRSIAGVVGPNNAALGNNATVYTIDGGDDGIGDNPDTPEDESDNDQILPVSKGTALGANSHVGHDNSTAIGAGAQSTDDHQVTLGTKDDTIRAEGITSKKSKARQVGPIELVTSDSGGRLATDGGETFNRIAHNSVLIDELTGGLAAVAAMPDSYLNPDENFALAAGFGGYSDKTAFGVLGTARLTNNLSAYGGASIPLDDGDIAWKVGGRVGF